MRIIRYVAEAVGAVTGLICFCCCRMAAMEDRWMEEHPLDQERGGEYRPP